MNITLKLALLLQNKSTTNCVSSLFVVFVASYCTRYQMLPSLSQLITPVFGLKV